VTGATNYLLQRATISGRPYRTIAYLETTSFVDRNAVANTTYYYVVKAVNGAGPGDASPQASAAASATPVVDLNSGLQRHYRFDGSGADSRRGPSVSIAGTATYTPGLLKQALVFDGSTNFATLQSLSGQDFREFTAATWIWRSSDANWQRIFDFGSGTANYMMLTFVNGVLRFEICRNSSTQAFETAAPPMDRWAHVAVTFVGNWATLYINGAVRITVLFSNNPTHLNLAQNYLGKSQFPDLLFKGRLDDFRLYNQGLSAAEVSALAAASLRPDRRRVRKAGQLNWTGVVNASTYNVKRATSAEGPTRPSPPA
jgi:Concanavalin A-like lectin/glucanases superfamily